MQEEWSDSAALLRHKDEIVMIAQSLKAVLGMDVIVVDKYLNRIVNTYTYRFHTGDIRINSVVGNIVMTQKVQMVYDRKYFTDCVNCPDYTTCEIGGVFGTPIMCGAECIGAIALLITPNDAVPFRQNQSAAVEFVQRLAALISEMVQNTVNRGERQAQERQLAQVLDSVAEAIAITNRAGVILCANQRFLAFFSGGKAAAGRGIDEVMAQGGVCKPAVDKHGPEDNLFYKKDGEVLRLRGMQSLDDGTGPGGRFLYLFDKVDTVSFYRRQMQAAHPPEILDTFFGKSAAMQRAKQNALRALRNHLSILVECRDRKQADELTRTLFMQAGQENRQVLKVDCFQDDDILEAVLLGQRDRFPGALSLARESVLYFNGIDYLPMHLQKRLADFLRGNWQGGRAPSHVRVIATSCQDLYAMVKKDYFCNELYNFISQNKISIPPVDGAPEDVRFYFEKYLARYERIYRRPPIRVREDAWEALGRHRWGEGVQAIREASERIAARLEDGELDAERLPGIFPGEHFGLQGKSILEQTAQSQLSRLLAEGATKEKIAEELGVSRATLYRWIEKYQLNERKNEEQRSESR